MVAPYGPALALTTLPGCSERSGAALEMPAFAGASELDQWRLEVRPPRPGNCARCDTTRGFTNLLCTFPRRGSLLGVSRAALVASRRTGPARQAQSL